VYDRTASSIESQLWSAKRQTQHREDSAAAYREDRRLGGLWAGLHRADPCREGLLEDRGEARLEDLLGDRPLWEGPCPRDLRRAGP
jgi:hypothetical protein